MDRDSEIPDLVVNSLLRLLESPQASVASPPSTGSLFTDPVEYRRRNPSMPEIVQRLQELAEDRVLVVRRIHPLGLESARQLFEYFSLFQAVEEVLLSHTIKKGRNQLRPARVAFVVFREPYDPTLLVGDFHLINSVSVQSQSFRHSATHAALDASIDDY
jgi:hypothetical protein